MTLTNTDLQQLFLDGEEYRQRAICLSTDSDYLARAAAAMPFVACELMRRRREAENHASQLQERDRDILRLRMQLRDAERR